VTEITTRHRLPPDLAAAIRAHRISTGLSTRQAAQAAGIGQGYLYFLERGDRCPSIVVALGLAFGLGLPADVTQRLLEVARPDVGRCAPGRLR
jgi:transcriptional regulator with XRE-family HTH domain